MYVQVVGRAVSFLPLPLWCENVLLWPLASRILGTDFSKIVTLANGLRMETGMDDALNRTLLFKGAYKPYIWEPVTIRMLEILSKGAHSICIAGSHIGYTVLMAAKETTGRVVTCEPVEYLYQRSKRNVALNADSTHVSLHKCALGEQPGVVEMYVSNIRSSIIPYSRAHSSDNKETVSMTTIDALAHEEGIHHFDLIFLDVEGYELFALKGARAMLANTPDLILEVCPRVLERSGQTKDALYEFLRQQGYTIYVIADEYGSEASRHTSKIRLIPQVAGGTGYDSDYFNILATTKNRFSLEEWASMR